MYVAGIDYTTKNCDCTPVNNFWDEFSSRFAKAANGNGFFLANGERTDGHGAYYEGSVFGRIEIPDMNPNILKQIVVMTVHRGGKGIVLITAILNFVFSSSKICCAFAHTVINYLYSSLNEPNIISQHYKH